MKKLFGFLLSGETIFVLFLFAGTFKESFNFPIDLTIFFMVLSILISLKRILQNPIINKAEFQPSILFIIFSVWMLFSVYYTINFSSGLDKTLRFIIIVGWSFFGPLLLMKTDDSIRKFISCLLVLGLFFSFSAIYQYIQSGQQIGSVAVFGSNYLSLGRVSGISAIILLNHLLWTKLNFKKKLIGYALFLILVISIVISAGRGPLLMLVLTILILCMFQVRLGMKNYILYYNKSFVFFALVIVGMSIFYANFSNLSVFQTINIRIERALTEQGGGASIMGRTERYDMAIRMFSEKPLTGYGSNSFGYYFGTTPGDYPHNIFLEAASELGIVGLLILVLLILLSLVKFFSYFLKVDPKVEGEKKKIGWIILTLFLFTFFNANVSGQFIGNRVVFSFIAIMFIFRAITFPSHKTK